MSGITIDGKPIAEFDPAQLEEINQALGRKVDAIQDQRRIINAVLAQRRAKAEAQRLAVAAADAVADAKRADDAAAGVDAQAPGAVIVIDTAKL